MRRPALLIAGLIALIVLSHSPLVKAEDGITEAYKAVLDADRAGGNVTALVEKLNRAIELRAKDPEAAARLASEIIAESKAVKEQGISSARQGLIVKSVALASLLALAGISYLYLPRAVWRFWLRHRRNWRVRK